MGGVRLGGVRGEGGGGAPSEKLIGPRLTPFKSDEDLIVEEQMSLTGREEGGGARR